MIAARLHNGVLLSENAKEEGQVEVENCLVVDGSELCWLSLVVSVTRDLLRPGNVMRRSE